MDKSVHVSEMYGVLDKQFFVAPLSLRKNSNSHFFKFSEGIM